MHSCVDRPVILIRLTIICHTSSASIALVGQGVCAMLLSNEDTADAKSVSSLRYLLLALQGAKAAAVRKLHHELGISPAQLPADSFKYLTRLHYCAGDRAIPGGEPTGWGEHEMDYILFAKADVDVEPNPEEVQSIAFVTEAELHDMMAPSNGLLWSPWFRIIVNKFLVSWWKDLDRTLATDNKANWKTIHHILE